MSFSQSASRLAGLCALLLGWRPGEFWGATPAELRAILEELERARGGGAPPGRGELQRLMEMFPDG